MDGAFYTTAIALLALVALTAVRTQVALFLARSTTGRRTSYPLNLYETAYLAGGPRRVINTALVSLVAQGGVRVSSEGIVTPVQGFRPNNRIPVERAVYRHVTTGAGGRTTAEVRHSAGGDHAMRRLSTPLWRQGFLMAPADRVRSRRRTSRLVVFAALAAIVAVVSPFLRGPLGAVVIAAAAAVVGTACFYWLRRHLAIPLTKAGRNALERAEPQALADGSWKSSDDIRLVALHGLTKLPDRRLAGTLRRDTRARGRLYATCCAPGHCGSYGGGVIPAYDSGYSGSDSGGGFFDFGGLFDFGGGSHGSHGGGYDGGGGGGDSGGGGGGDGGGGDGGGGGGCGGGGS
ncbi:TIGR04222 domain-containing membrane protein [Nonomuraea sp. M3C6]|uniref:TIGR04222 domain-containing membrane protein n=1 Tax=Nonomuraea marmarensis TaxID=3351344 RepID=A0ABW7A6S8_9ACTN